MSSRFRRLPSYRYFDSADGIIENPAVSSLRDCTVTGNHGKNLIPYPFYETTKTTNGITFTDNGDGTITANGTTIEPGTMCQFDLSRNTQIDTTKKYVLSGGNAPVIMVLAMYKGGTWKANIGNPSGGTVIDFSEYSDIDFDRITVRFYLRGDYTLNNFVIKPQLELGETATEFEPYKGVGDYDEASGKYIIPILNDTRENLLNIGDMTVPQSGGYYGVEVIYLTDSNINAYLPHLEEMKGKNVTYTSDLDNDNFMPEIVFWFNEVVDNGQKYIGYQINNYARIFPNATPIRIEVRARSGNADFDGTNVKISNISMKFTDFEPEVTNIYTDTQITDGESVSLKENGLADVKLHGKNILSVGTSVKPSAVNWQYYKY